MKVSNSSKPNFSPASERRDGCAGLVDIRHRKEKYGKADPVTKARKTRALFAAMQELDLTEALLITRDYSETLSDEDKTIRIIPFYAWALKQWQ